jgi:hypothetical protein
MNLNNVYGKDTFEKYGNRGEKKENGPLIFFNSFFFKWEIEMKGKISPIFSKYLP